MPSLVVFFGVGGVTDLAAQTSFESVFPTGASSQEFGRRMTMATYSSQGSNARNLAFIYSGPLNPLPPQTPQGFPQPHLLSTRSLRRAFLRPGTPPRLRPDSLYGPNTSYYNSDNIPAGKSRQLVHTAHQRTLMECCIMDLLTGGTSAAIGRCYQFQVALRVARWATRSLTA